MKVLISNMSELKKQGLSVEAKFAELGVIKEKIDEELRQSIASLTGKEVVLKNGVNNRVFFVEDQEYSYKTVQNVVVAWERDRIAILNNISRSVLEFNAKAMWNKEEDSILVSVLEKQIFKINLKTLDLSGFKATRASIKVLSKVQPFLEKS